MTDQYAVMGNPVSHSKSPKIHTLFAQQTHQALEYTAIEVPLDQFNTAVDSFIKNNGRGLNITVPFKQQAWKLVDALSERARRAQAVNTIIVNPDGSLTGDNTDGLGMVADISVNHALDIQGLNILVVGAGGAVRGILEPLIGHNPGSLQIVNRTLSNAQALANNFKDLYKIDTYSFDQLANKTASNKTMFDLIINGSSASLSGELPPLPDNILKPGGCCYDMMYSDSATVFITWGLAQGASLALDGLGMLVEQAAESFQLWRGVRPDTKAVFEMLRPSSKP